MQRPSGVDPGPIPSDGESYSQRWVGRALIVHPRCWRGAFGDSAEAEDDRQSLIATIRKLRPTAVIVDLHDVQIMAAIRAALLVRIVKALRENDASRHCFVVGATPPVVEYFRVNHIDKILVLCSSETEALTRAAAMGAKPNEADARTMSPIEPERNEK